MKHLAEANKIGIILASNFALGAVLMMYFAKLASKYMDYAEIIELHHSQKADAPSGTSLTTARAMAVYRGRPFSQSADAGKDFTSGDLRRAVLRFTAFACLDDGPPGSAFRRAWPNSQYPPRYYDRECYVPGVLLAVQAVVKQQGLIQGLDNLLNYNCKLLTIHCIILNIIKNRENSIRIG